MASGDRDDSKVLRSAIKSGSFAPVYYLFGDDEYVKGEQLRRVLDAAVDSATRDFNLEVLRGGDVEAESLASLLRTPPMMADRRSIVIRDVHALKREARRALDDYLERPLDDVLLLLVAPSGAKPDKVLAARSVAVEFKPLAGERIPKWISYYVERDLHSSITDGAVKLLQEAVGTELAQLKVELDKLASYVGDAPINEAAVSAVVGVQPGRTMGDLLDAVARRDGQAALAMLPDVMQQPKVSAATVIMALSAQTLAIGWAQAARDSGTHPARLKGELFTVLKESGSVFTGRSWGEFVDTCARDSDRWTPRAIDDALAALLRAESGAKESKLSSDEQLLATLILSLCDAPRRREAA
jgi:DNA polymerase-3 subunit delta